jgi:hypothetical protein
MNISARTSVWSGKDSVHSRPWPFFLALILFLAVRLGAAVTNELSEAETQGRLFAQKVILQLVPSENYSNSVVLQVRANKSDWTNYLVTSRVLVAKDQWKNIFTSDALKPTNEIFTVTHILGQPNLFMHEAVFGASSKMLSSAKTAPFANSDFWLGDLALDFLHWPQQRILKKEFHRNCACTVLESVNPHPEPNGYSRIKAWIDNESLGVIEAYAYDANGKLLKELRPISVIKVRGQYQVKEIEIANVQTRSRSRLVFDWK